MFGKLRQGSGRTYINPQQILKKVRIYKLKLILLLGRNIDEVAEFFTTCQFVYLDINLSNVFLSLPELEEKLETNVKKALVYIFWFIFSEYVTKTEKGKAKILKRE